MEENKKLEVIVKIVNDYLKVTEYSVREFSNKCGVSRSFMSNLVNGKKKRMISYGQIGLLARGLNMSIEDLTQKINILSEDSTMEIQTCSDKIITKIQNNQDLLLALEKICRDKQLINVVIQISSMEKKDLQMVLHIIETISKSK